MKSLSAVIITFNEEHNILTCLNSLIGVVDEIVVVDSFSTDRTKDICLQKGVRFIETAFRGYGLQKRFATDQASNDYVLNLDADEFLSARLSKSILEQKIKGFPFDGYTMNRLSKFAGHWIRHGSWYPDRKLRIFNRQKGNWTEEIVHEGLDMQPGCKLSHLRGDLMHNAYDNISQYKAKNEKYSALSALSLFNDGKRTSIVNVILNPAWTFFKSYMLHLGFLDGKDGLLIAKQLSEMTYMKHSKLLKMQREFNAS